MALKKCTCFQSSALCSMVVAACVCAGQGCNGARRDRVHDPRSAPAPARVADALPAPAPQVDRGSSAVVFASASGDADEPPVTGALPAWAATLDRDREPLSPGALVRFQSLARGPIGMRHNYRWVLYEDGRLFVSRHSGDLTGPVRAFDRPYPAQPTRRLPLAEVDRVRARLVSARFASQSPYQANPGMRDGSRHIVTARLDGRVHEVMYDAFTPSLADFLRGIADRE